MILDYDRDNGGGGRGIGEGWSALFKTQDEREKMKGTRFAYNKRSRCLDSS